MQMEDLIELAKRVQAQQAEAQTVEVKAAHRGCPAFPTRTAAVFSCLDWMKTNISQQSACMICRICRKK